MMEPTLFDTSTGRPDAAQTQRTQRLSDGTERVQVTVERVRWRSPEGDRVILVVSSGDDSFTALGSMLGATEGDQVDIIGRWNHHPKHGKQFEFTSYESELPAEAETARAYLTGGKIPGIGPTTARAIVSHFGDESLRVLDETPERLTEVPGIGAKKRDTIIEGWAATADQRGIAIVLSSVGASQSLAHPIFKAFGADGAKMITEQPYALTKAKGIGFTTCDTIATTKLGWKLTAPERISAGIAYTLEQAELDGHCYLPVPDLIESCAGLLDVSARLAGDAIGRAVLEERVIVEGEQVWTPRLHHIETDLAAQIRRLTLAAVLEPTGVQTQKIETLLQERSLTDEQEQAVRAVLAGAVTVLTGGPGVGKSHTIATVADAAAVCGWRLAMCAPTGRAARRMSEACDGAPARTVHRLIGIGKGGVPEHDPDQPLIADVVVCDEASMLDAALARQLLRAVRTGARVLLVGDIDQLPSVGPGNVLGDLIGSRSVPTVALTKIFRQAETSGIIPVAHQVNAGDFPRLHGWDDVFLWETKDPAVAAERVVSMVCDRIPKRFGVDPGDIQVLVPQKKGSCGTIELNRRLQETLNPGVGVEYATGTVVFRPGDRAMVVKNNYDKGAAGVFNGTPVRVASVDPDGGDAAVTVVTEDGEAIAYKASEVGQLMLAYAITIHKSQGSQYPCVVIPMTNQAYTMLKRNLFYTGVTRAQKRVVIVGAPAAIGKAVATPDTATRWTALAARLSVR